MKVTDDFGRLIPAKVQEAIKDLNKECPIDAVKDLLEKLEKRVEKLEKPTKKVVSPRKVKSEKNSNKEPVMVDEFGAEVSK